MSAIVTPSNPFFAVRNHVYFDIGWPLNRLWMALVLHPACKVFDPFWNEWAPGPPMLHRRGMATWDVEWNILLVNNWSAGWCLNGKLWGLSDILVPHRKTMKNVTFLAGSRSRRLQWCSLRVVACISSFKVIAQPAAKLGKTGYSMLRLLFHEYSHLQF